MPKIKCVSRQNQSMVGNVKPFGPCPPLSQKVLEITNMETAIPLGSFDDTITLGMQFQNKKFMLTLNNMLKGKSSEVDILYGMILKLKEKLSMIELENQQCTVKKNEVLKIQEVA